jgi:hypothetical protein
MPVRQEIIGRTNSPFFWWRLTNKVSFSADIYGCIFQALSAMHFLPTPFAGRCGPQFEKHYVRPFRTEEYVVNLWRYEIVVIRDIVDINGQLEFTRFNYRR